MTSHIFPYSQWENKIHVPNHQPDMAKIWLNNIPHLVHQAIPIKGHLKGGPSPFELRAVCAEHVPTPWDISDTPGTTLFFSRIFFGESHMLHVWNMYIVYQFIIVYIMVYLHLVHFGGKCWNVFHTWIIWEWCSPKRLCRFWTAKPKWSFHHRKKRKTMI